LEKVHLAWLPHLPPARLGFLAGVLVHDVDEYQADLRRTLKYSINMMMKGLINVMFILTYIGSKYAALLNQRFLTDFF
jgi:hypothetical protein